MFTMAMKNARPSQVFELQRQLVARLVSTACKRCDEFVCDWLNVHSTSILFIDIGNTGRAGFGHAL